MSPRPLRQESNAQQLDAFVATVLPAKPQRHPVEPRVGPVEEAQELWLGVHLPQLATASQGRSDDERRNLKVLERLAMSAQQFTPRVSLAPPDGLLLEVKGSLKLFDGVPGLWAAIEASHRSAGVESVLALAPTPLAALASARACQTEPVLDRARLVSRMSPLTLAALRWPGKVLERLAKIGVYTVGQALRLPRAGFARRFGAAQLASLDRLIGRVADPQARFRPRERFRRRRELLHELEDQALLLETLAPLFNELSRFLEARQCGITWLECRLRHRHASPTLCLLQLAEPAADAQRLGALLGEKLMSLTLPEPVRACELRSSVLVPCAWASGPLWQPGERGGEVAAGASHLIERLRARLGEEAVQGLGIVPDHRPEKVSSTGEGQGWGHPEKRFSSRPLWLLPAPQQLAESDGLPRYRGPLRVSGPPERIETGWWDGSGITRDYYIALDVYGVRLWIFRERNASRRWFLHGMFG